jgi:hypothetical protein
MGHDFAEAAIKIEAARLLTYNAARLKVGAVRRVVASRLTSVGGGAAVYPAGGDGKVSVVGLSGEHPLKAQVLRLGDCARGIRSCHRVDRWRRLHARSPSREVLA